MTVRGFATAFAVLAAAAALSGGAYWALLNVPESNVLALLLSVGLVALIGVLMACAIGITVGVAGGGGLRESVRGAHRSIPGFLAGAVVFAALWWLTTAIDTQWDIHRGEIDALFLRYAGTANTSWAHTTSSWLTWLIRWDAGLLAVAGAIAGSYSRRGVLSGVGRAFDGLSVVACTLALVSGYWLWKITYWRPAMNPGTTEVMFVAAKLGLLACLGVLLAAIVVHAVARVSAATPRV